MREPSDHLMSRRQALTMLGLLGAAPVVLAGCNTRPSRPSAESADVIFRNGTVYTVDPAKPRAEAVATRGKQIVQVGTTDEVMALAGPSTRVVDLDGGMLLPGFAEGHIHPIAGSAITRGVDLQFDTRDAILEALRNYAPTVAGGGPVRGFGWRYDAFPATGPRREDLDAIWPDRPVLLIAIDAHSAWVNTKTLELAGITKDSTDPVPGFSVFQRDPDGTPTGYLVEVPAYMQVLNSVVPMDEAFVAESLTQWAPRASEAGITSMFDAGVEIMPEDKAFGHYRDLESAGKLPFRVTGSYYYNDPKIDPLPKIIALRDGPQSELVHVNVLKIVMDGVDAGRTAAMLAPYADQPDTSGQSLFTAEQVNDVVKRADAQGIDVHVHCIGDRSTRMTLDAIDAAIETNPPRDRRNAIAHLQCVDPQDIPRLGALGVIAQISAQWATPDPYWRNVTTVRLGPERANRMYAFKSLADGGARLSFGCDWPAASYYSTFRPLEAIEIAVTRQELGKPDQAPLPRPEERLSLDQAIAAQTMGPAYQLRRENDLGSITVGKLADLVVLDKDLTAIPPHEIHQAAVKLTMMNGVVRHEK